ncbi:MAG: PadR family transcriptional regulator [Anaerovoracaceae bacterium]
MNKCACKGSFLDKFIQPAVLIMLWDEPSYGFRLLSDLKEKGLITDEGVNPAGFYRALKKMEEQSLISSAWDTESGNKPRRIFTITDDGKKCMKNWRNTLIEYKDHINLIIDTIADTVD